MELEAVIGLETHVQLKTKTKLFCSCSNDSDDAKPNTNICPICLAHPGTLPVINKEALAWAVRASLMLNCKINELSQMDRKNYFYPDLPKGYQISQFGFPVGYDGAVTYYSNGDKKEIHLERLHVEEDAAKNIHDGGATLVDYNRGGTPLCEIVTKPEFKTPEDAKAYMQTLRLTMRYLNISDADMEKGHLRCDANISMRPRGETKLYPKTEIKNLNSFRAVEKALKYEIERQTKLWKDGNPPSESTTRGWNDENMNTTEQRSKEESHDYRYFPEPDLPPLIFKTDAHPDKKVCDSTDEIHIECIRATLPERPGERMERFMKEYQFSSSDADTLIQDDGISGYAENTMSSIKAWLRSENEIGPETEKLGKTIGGWLTGEVVKNLKENNLTYKTTPMLEKDLAALLGMLVTKRITSNIAQQLLAEMVKNSTDPVELMKDKGIEVLNDDNELDAIVSAVLSEHSTVADQYKNGKIESLQFLIGMVMRASKGAADPDKAKEMLIEKMK